LLTAVGGASRCDSVFKGFSDCLLQLGDNMKVLPRTPGRAAEPAAHLQLLGQLPRLCVHGAGRLSGGGRGPVGEAEGGVPQPGHPRQPV
ncbi:unnamed protein product, partial [Tetraodon nigroviridis]